MKHIVIGAFVLLAACSSSPLESTPAEVSPLERCTGNYHCTWRETKVFDTNLHRDSSDVCYFGGIALRPDGSAQISGAPNAFWTGTTSHLSVCDDVDDCRVCDAIDAPPPSAPSGEGQCAGSPDSCSSKSPGSCSDIRGCRMASHLRGNGSWDNVCEGTPADCSDMTDQKHCLAQGCTWK